MVAPSKNFTAIPDDKVDSDSGLTLTLLTQIRDSLIHLEEWLGKDFTAAINHDHDGVNSELVNNLVIKGPFALSSGTLNEITGITAEARALHFIAKRYRGTDVTLAWPELQIGPSTGLQSSGYSSYGMNGGSAWRIGQSMSIGGVDWFSMGTLRLFDTSDNTWMIEAPSLRSRIGSTVLTLQGNGFVTLGAGNTLERIGISLTSGSFTGTGEWGVQVET